jgi:hypothetical protein
LGESSEDDEFEEAARRERMARSSKKKDKKHEKHGDREDQSHDANEGNEEKPAAKVDQNQSKGGGGRAVSEQPGASPEMTTDTTDDEPASKS